MRYERAVTMMEAELGEELVALEPTRGHCFGFNEVAATVWKSLATPKSFDTLKGELLGDFDVDAATCERELQTLLDSMIDQGLVRTTASA